MSDEREDRITALDSLLLALPARRSGMLLSTFDGFAAGLHLSPQPIATSEWLPLVFGADEGGPAFGTEEEAATAARLLLDHHEAVGHDLAGHAYAPIFDFDFDADERIREAWIDGFVTAMDFRADDWLTLLRRQDDIAAALGSLVVLEAINNGECDLSEAEIEAYEQQAPEMIPLLVQAVYDARAVHDPARGGPEAGRNDPCPCGSGTAYKKCCGA